MSGIGGIILLDGATVTPAMLDRMASGHPHPVRDGTDRWHDGPAGLLRFALKLTPESLGETQPFLHPESGTALLFDGRLDNRDDLLGRVDGVSSKVADGAIVLAAFLRFGDEAIHLLTGDYALALWTAKNRRLYCARSPVGWRPFLWHCDAKRFAFATEPKTLIAGLGLPRKLNEGLIAEHMAGRMVSLTDTFWDGIFRLAPGFALTLEQGRVRSWCWNTGPFKDFSGCSETEHVEEFNLLFDQALVAAHRSQGPVTAQLSGGLDSSSVVCRSVQLYHAGRVSGLVQPVSARFPGQACDEGFWIEAVERQTGITSASVSPVAFDADAAATWCADTLQIPLRPNVLATLAPVCDWMQARDRQVLLTGEGGDDWFGGGRGHWPDLLLAGRWLKLWREGMDQGGGTVLGKLLALVRQGALPLLSSRYPDIPRDRPGWLRPEWARKTSLRDRFASAPALPPLPSFAQRKRYAVFATGRRYGGYDPVLSYVASRGMELRHPFHDLRLSQFTMTAAGEILNRSGVRKHLLREAMLGVLPEEVRGRNSKASFATPMINAVTERLRQKNLEDLLPAKLGWIDAGQVRRIHQDYLTWLEAGAQRPFPPIAYGVVWNAVGMDIWLERAARL